MRSWFLFIIVGLFLTLPPLASALGGLSQIDFDTPKTKKSARDKNARRGSSKSLSQIDSLDRSSEGVVSLEEMQEQAKGNNSREEPVDGEGSGESFEEIPEEKKKRSSFIPVRVDKNGRVIPLSAPKRVKSAPLASPE